MSDATPDRFEGPFLDTIIESWRFSRIFARALSRLDAGDASRYFSQLRFFTKRLEELLSATGLKLVNLEGQQYDAGMAATPINIGDFASDEPLFVEQMLEPVILGENGIIRTGTVTLKRSQA